jgi:hypothetical protein
MKSETRWELTAVLLLIGVFTLSGISVYEHKTSEYWRKQYDKTKNPVILACGGKVEGVFTLAEHRPSDSELIAACPDGRYEFWAKVPSVTQVTLPSEILPTKDSTGAYHCPAGTLPIWGGLNQVEVSYVDGEGHEGPKNPVPRCYKPEEKWEEK